MLGESEGRRIRWQGQRRRWLDDITNSMGMSLSKVQEIVEDRAAWCVAVHGVRKSWTRLSDWTTSTTTCKRDISKNRIWGQRGHHGPLYSNPFENLGKHDQFLEKKKLPNADSRKNSQPDLLQVTVKKYTSSQSNFCKNPPGFPHWIVTNILGINIFNFTQSLRKNRKGAMLPNSFSWGWNNLDIKSCQGQFEKGNSQVSHTLRA